MADKDDVMRFGLCCPFVNEPVSFRSTTAKTLLRLPRDRQLAKLSDLCIHNARSLLQALEVARRLGIDAFRIMSPLFPRMTHPEVGYSLQNLPEGAGITGLLSAARDFAAANNIRLSFHTDQFVVLSSPHRAVVGSSVRELQYQGLRQGRDLTVDVEAKVKEMVVVRLMTGLRTAGGI